MNINLNPNSELNQSIVNVPDVVQVPDVWINEARQFRMAMMMYACAIREVKTKLEVLNDQIPCKEAYEYLREASAPGAAGIGGVYGEKSG